MIGWVPLGVPVNGLGFWVQEFRVADKGSAKD